MAKPTAVIVGVGAERGVGAAVCRRFASEGYHVIAAGRTASKLQQVVDTIGKSRGSAEFVIADATREDDVIKLFDHAMGLGSGFEAPDAVVFNAGINQHIDFRTLTVEQFESFWRICCFGGFLVGREAARRLVPLGRGTVISIVLVMFCLPQILLLGARVIEKTSFSVPSAIKHRETRGRIAVDGMVRGEINGTVTGIMHATVEGEAKLELLSGAVEEADGHEH